MCKPSNEEIRELIKTVKAITPHLSRDEFTMVSLIYLRAIERLDIKEDA